MAASIVTARILGKVAFGELGMVTATLGLLGLFGGLGLSTTATKYVAEWRTSDPNRAGRIAGLCIVISALAGLFLVFLTLAGADYLASTALNAPHLARFIRIGSPLLLVGAVAGVQGGVLAGLESFRSLTLITVIVGLASFPITVCGVVLAGFGGAVLATAAIGAVSVVLLYLAGRPEYKRWGLRVSLHGMWEEHQALWAFSVPGFLSSLLFLGAPWVANAILVHGTAGYGELGAFNAANQWRNLVLFVPAAIANVTLPVLTELFSAGDAVRYGKALKVNLWGSLLVAVAIAVPVVVLGEWVMLLYGRDFVGAWPVVTLLCVAAVLQAACNVAGYAIASSGRMWAGFVLNLFWAASLVGLAAALAPRWGALGIAASTLSAYALFALMVSVYTKRIAFPIPERTGAAGAELVNDSEPASPTVDGPRLGLDR